jgi:inosine-uridine nucleoside N-ribohydrolase
MVYISVMSHDLTMTVLVETCSHAQFDKLMISVNNLMRQVIKYFFNIIKHNRMISMKLTMLSPVIHRKIPIPRQI